METVVLAAFALGLAAANGANDNLKGFATVYGSGELDYRATLRWATLSTLAGAFAAVLVGSGLAALFSGKGLVPDDVARDPTFAAAVGGAAMATVALATRLGLPVSTTHALAGALVGVGASAAPAALDLGRLSSMILLPLALSPFVAGLLAWTLVRLDRQVRGGTTTEHCVCIDTEVVPNDDGTVAAGRPTLVIGTAMACDRDGLPGVRAATGARGLHLASAAVLSFARGLNDTPKIAGLLLLAGAGWGTGALVAVALAMALGGLWGARRVVETMAHRIAPLEARTALPGNLVSSSLVLCASFWTLPVSTTHVSCGALFGLGAADGNAQWATVRRILSAWIVTLPLAATIAYLAHRAAIGLAP